MSNFDPDQAAKLSDDVYALTKLDTLEEAMFSLNMKYGGVFKFSESNMMKGRTGGPGYIKCRTAFGFCLLGKVAPYIGHAVIVFRGTQYLADWLTNLNVNTSYTLTGQKVHDGFAESFKSMAPQLMNFMSSDEMKTVHTIHCVGHSLGGALATICGDWVKSAYGRAPFVYSFGSPRVGLYSFAQACGRNVGAERVYRAFHKTDIVPCIPTWPYYHTPLENQGRDYFLPSPGTIPMAEYHGMEHYIKSVDEKSWESLAALRDEGKDESRIKRWLTETVPASISMSSINNLSEALSFVIVKCYDGARWLLSKTFTNSFTFMDQLAYILDKGINLAGSASEWVLKLIKKIMQMLGMVGDVKLEDLSVRFMRDVLVNMQLRIAQFTKDAFNHVMVNGRAI